MLLFVGARAERTGLCEVEGEEREVLLWASRRLLFESEVERRISGVGSA